MAHLSGKGAPRTRRQIEEQFGIGTRTAKRELGEMVTVGTVEFVGCAGTGHYRLTARARP